MNKKTIEFLKESNAIESVFDDDSLKQAEYAWKYLVSQKHLTSGVVLKTHKILMLHQKLLPDEKGYYRKRPVWIGSRPGLSHVAIPTAMTALCEDINLFPKSWMSHHVRFEEIHPFIDGNGRVGRMLLNWERKKIGLPILVIKASEKQEYYAWFGA